jgi:hypothetical protein
LSSKQSKPTSPEWLERTLKRLSFIHEGKAEVVEAKTGYCCLKHELEFGPVELDLFRVSMPLPLGADREDGKLIYDVVRAEARSAAKHRVIHMIMDPDGFQISLAPYKKRKKWKKKPRSAE